MAQQRRAVRASHVGEAVRDVGPAERRRQRIRVLVHRVCLNRRSDEELGEVGDSVHQHEIRAASFLGAWADVLHAHLLADVYRDRHDIMAGFLELQYAECRVQSAGESQYDYTHRLPLDEPACSEISELLSIPYVQILDCIYKHNFGSIWSCRMQLTARKSYTRPAQCPSPVRRKFLRAPAADVVSRRDGAQFLRLPPAAVLGKRTGRPAGIPQAPAPIRRRRRARSVEGDQRPLVASLQLAQQVDDLPLDRHSRAAVGSSRNGRSGPGASARAMQLAA